MDNNHENPLAETTESQTQRRETSHPFNSENLTRVTGRMGRLDFAILSLG